MDRCSFFASLPFVIKLSSPSWPPSVPYVDQRSDVLDDNYGKGKTTEADMNQATPTIILGETDQYSRPFYLSIECVTDPDKTPILEPLATPEYQQAFFLEESDPIARADTREYHVDSDCCDPAMVSIQIAVYERNGNRSMEVMSSERRCSESAHRSNNFMFHRNVTPLRRNTSYSKSRNSYEITTTSGSFRSPNRHFRSKNDPLRQKLNTPSFNRSILYLKMHDHIYALDMSQLLKYEVLSEVYQNHPKGTTLEKATTKLSSILEYDEHGSGSTGRTSRCPMIKPPSLVLYFDSICLRIFSVPKTAFQNKNKEKTVMSSFPSRDDIREEMETLHIIYDKINCIVQIQQEILSLGSSDAIQAIKLREADIVSQSSSEEVSGSISRTYSSCTPPLGIGQKDSAGIYKSNSSSVTTNSSPAINETNQQKRKWNQDSVQESKISENETITDLIETTELSEIFSYKRRKRNDQRLYELLRKWHVSVTTPSTLLTFSNEQGKQSKENQNDMQVCVIQADNATHHHDYSTSIRKTPGRCADCLGASYVSSSIVELLETYHQREIFLNNDKMKYCGKVFYPMTVKRNYNATATINAHRNSSYDNKTSSWKSTNVGTNATAMTGAFDHQKENSKGKKYSADDDYQRNDSGGDNIHALSDNENFIKAVRMLVSKNKLLFMEKYKVSLIPERG